MARTQNKLTTKKVEGLKAPARYSDGGGLYLDITRGGTKSWVFLFRSPVHRMERNGKQVGRPREMGLGPFGADQEGRVSLAKARDLADGARRLIAVGADPLDERNKPVPIVIRVPTFGEMAAEFVSAMERQWHNEKHRAQWRTTLKEHAKALTDKPVDQIGVEDVLGVLKPIWHTTPETAGRLRGRIERVLNAAKAAGHRKGENPATWRGHLENLLAKRPKLSRGHHPAMPWADLPEFMTKLRQREGVSALAVEFLILTAARSGEVRGASRGEFDLVRQIWTVPAERMKMKREHRVPLVPRAVEIIKLVFNLPPTAFAFPGKKAGAPLSDMSLSAVLRRMKVPAETASIHGFRSSFKDWASEATSFPNELSEAALAHVFGDETERAYRRGDVLGRRKKLMEAWARYCAGGSVVRLDERRLQRDAREQGRG